MWKPSFTSYLYSSYEDSESMSSKKRSSSPSRCAKENETSSKQQKGLSTQRLAKVYYAVIKDDASQSGIRVPISRDVMEINSDYFREMFEGMNDDETELVLIEHNPEEAATFIQDINESALFIPGGAPRIWGFSVDKVKLSIKWMLDRFVEYYGEVSEGMLSEINQDVCEKCHRYHSEYVPPELRCSNCSSRTIMIVKSDTYQCPCCHRKKPLPVSTGTKISMSEIEKRKKSFWDLVELSLTHESIGRRTKINSQKCVVNFLRKNFDLWGEDEIMLKYLTPSDLLNLGRQSLEITSSSTYVRCAASQR